MMPSEFWEVTIDEVEAVIRGKVDDWRYARRNAHLIHVSMVGSDKAVSITGALPLPYDEEIKDDTVGPDDLEEFYKNAARFSDIDWSKKTPI